ncbi:MAG: DUF502 domain-containing protein [Candidatus Eisenbacteria bacterium]
MGRWSGSLRSRFLAGVLVTVPLIITYLALRFLFQTVDGVLGPAVAGLVGRNVPGFGLLATLVIVLAVGVLAASLAGRRLFEFGEKMLAALPLVRTVYQPAREIIHALAAPERQPFREVVLVEYPRKGIYSYAFVTSYTVRRGPAGEAERLANVLVPTPPIPTTGHLIVVPVAELIYLDLPVEAALKLILSGGIVTPAELREKSPGTGGARKGPEGGEGA